MRADMAPPPALSWLRERTTAAVPGTIEDADLACARQIRDGLAGLWRAEAAIHVCRLLVLHGAPAGDLALLGESVEAGDAAVAAISPVDHPGLWALAAHRSGGAMANLARVTGDFELFEQAIARLRRAAASTAADFCGSTAAGRHLTLAQAAFVLGEMRSGPAFLAEAARHYERAAEFFEDAGETASLRMARLALVECLDAHAGLTAEASLIERAIAILDALRAEAASDGDAETEAQCARKLASAVFTLAYLRASPEDARRAVAIERENLAATPRDDEAEDWANQAADVARALELLGDITADPIVLHEGVSYANEALAVPDLRPPVWARIAIIRADCLISLGRITADAGLLRRAVREISEALDRPGSFPSPSDRANVLDMRVRANLHIGDLEHDAPAYQAAIADIDAALAVYTQDGAQLQWAELSAKRARAAARRANLAGDAQALKDAVAAFAPAVDAFAQMDAAFETWAPRTSRGEAILSLAQTPGSARADLDLARGDFEAVRSHVSVSADPLIYVRAARGAAAVALLAGDTGTARDEALALLDDIDGILATTSDAFERSQLLRAASGTGDIAAMALIAGGRIAEAVLALERGRATALRRRLAEAEADLDAAQREVLADARLGLAQCRRAHKTAVREAAPHRDIAALAEALAAQHGEVAELARQFGLDASLRDPISIPDLQSLLQGTDIAAAVALVATEGGGAALIVPALGDPGHVRLPNLTASTVEALLWRADGRGWFDAYRRFRGDLDQTGGFGSGSGRADWLRAVECGAASLWEAAMGDLDVALRARGISEGATIALAPGGRLAALPLHAAGTADRRFGDTWPVVIAPGLAALSASCRRVMGRADADGGLLAVTDPASDFPSHTNPAISSFPPAQTIEFRGRDARREAVVPALPEARYVSIFSHGWWDSDRPDESRILLAGGDAIPAQDFSDIDLAKCRMITLCACETGVPGVKIAPDEFEGLPAALLAAGAPGVLATLWPVFSRDAEALVAEFYRLHKVEGMSPAMALQAARRACQTRNSATHTQDAALGLRPNMPASADRNLAGNQQAPDMLAWAAFVYYGA